MGEPVIRELRKKDLWDGFLTTLDSLRPTSDIGREKAEEIFERINSNPDHIVVIAKVDGEIVASTTLLIEPKFIHKGGLVGHIEDVVVKQDFQGQKIGKEIMRYILEFARDRGCYKTILDCTDDVKPFYEKIGFKHTANELRFDHC